MKLKAILQNRTQVTIGAFVFTALILLWEYVNGGVVTHHLMASKDLPGFSNWWGLVTIPLLCFIAVTIIKRQQDKETKVLKRFITAFAFGLLIAVFWELNVEGPLPYMMLFPLLLAFFTPIHKPEVLMGYVLGMLFTFGGVLPILFGSILLIMAFIINTIVRVLMKALTNRTTNK